MFLIALGSNLAGAAGGPRAMLEAALGALAAEGLAVAARSSWYRTPAFPPGSGPDFVNGAARLETDLPPAAVLAALHRVERALGRDRRERWGPRVCDLDLLAVAARSNWYRTPAFPPGSGPDFVNGAARLDTDLPPAAVLAALHRVERALGRDRRERWGPRVCDLDLLAAGDLVLPDRDAQAAWMALDAAAQAARAPGGLVLPHPRLQERAFVLVPLAEIAPDWVHPVLGRSVRAMRDALPEADLASIARL